MPQTIREQLLLLQDKTYQEFHARLMPTVERERIIGVRVPLLRSFAREIAGTKAAQEFLCNIPHYYYEENNLHALLLEYIKDAEAQAEALELFLPCVDNWATCDLLRPKALMQEPEFLKEKIQKWLKSDKPYTVRFGIGMLLVRFLDKDFSPQFCELVSAVKSDEYYVKMMQAWYFATALAKQYDTALQYILEKKLDKWVHNKTIQKARESYRISAEQKEFLACLKRR